MLVPRTPVPRAAAMEQSSRRCWVERRSARDERVYANTVTGKLRTDRPHHSLLKKASPSQAVFDASPTRKRVALPRAAAPPCAAALAATAEFGGALVAAFEARATLREGASGARLSLQSFVALCDAAGLCTETPGGFRRVNAETLFVEILGPGYRAGMRYSELCYALSTFAQRQRVAAKDVEVAVAAAPRSARKRAPPPPLWQQHGALAATAAPLAAARRGFASYCRGRSRRTARGTLEPMMDKRGFVSIARVLLPGVRNKRLSAIFALSRGWGTSRIAFHPGFLRAIRELGAAALKASPAAQARLFDATSGAPVVSAAGAANVLLQRCAALPSTPPPRTRGVARTLDLAPPARGGVVDEAIAARLWHRTAAEGRPLFHAGRTPSSDTPVRTPGTGVRVAARASGTHRVRVSRHGSITIGLVPADVHERADAPSLPAAGQRSFDGAAGAVSLLTSPPPHRGAPPTSGGAVVAADAACSSARRSAVAAALAVASADGSVHFAIEIGALKRDERIAAFAATRGKGVAAREGGAAKVAVFWPTKHSPPSTQRVSPQPPTTASGTGGDIEQPSLAVFQTIGTESPQLHAPAAAAAAERRLLEEQMASLRRESKESSVQLAAMQHELAQGRAERVTLQAALKLAAETAAAPQPLAPSETPTKTPLGGHRRVETVRRTPLSASSSEPPRARVAKPPGQLEDDDNGSEIDTLISDASHLIEELDASRLLAALSTERAVQRAVVGGAAARELQARIADHRTMENVVLEQRLRDALDDSAQLRRALGDAVRLASPPGRGLVGARGGATANAGAWMRAMQGLQGQNPRGGGASPPPPSSPPIRRRLLVHKTPPSQRRTPRRNRVVPMQPPQLPRVSPQRCVQVHRDGSIDIN